jgi:NADH-quinone oxidoreductase subunit L
MEGPTPVSALIHAATMVAAGVYLVGRIFPVLTPTALLFVAYIGAITLILSALIAIVMTDIKRVLAYSTVSQLGYMILCLGLGGWVAGLFHLITHACFKALLFLGSGSVIHGCHGEQDVRKMGGLAKKMPITCITFLIATLAIAGFPGLSGFYSKDAMLASMLMGVWTKGHWILFILPALAAAITAFYMMRVYLLTFHTSVKDEHIHHHAHESPKAMWIPLALLAILSIGIGWFGQMPERKAHGHGVYSYEGGKGLVGLIAEAQPTWAVSWQMNETEPSEHSEHAGHGEHAFHTAATYIASGAMASGIILALLTYALGWISAENIARRLAPIHTLLANKFYFDELYRATFVAGVLKLAALGKWFDKTVLDGIADGSARWVVRTAFFSGRTLDNRGVDGAVNGAAALALAGGNLARTGQNGRVRNYILAMTTVVAVVILISAYFFFDWVK